jgi:hypothetical protein
MDVKDYQKGGHHFSLCIHVSLFNLYQPCIALPQRHVRAVRLAKRCFNRVHQFLYVINYHKVMLL